MTEDDILNAICDRRIVKAYWRDQGEDELILELHDGLRIKILAGATDSEKWDCDAYLTLNLADEES